MVDLHAHTDCSDGSLTPKELIDLACEIGLKSLAITDHDSIDGYDAAVTHAVCRSLDLVCGVELSTTFHGKPVHILGYFLNRDPRDEFRQYLKSVQKIRKERNQRLIVRLRQLGMSISLEDVEVLGRTQIGRPHFAQVLVNKGYVANYREAFDRYLDTGQPGYVERQDPSIDEVLSWIHDSGGISSWAHPMRFVEKEGSLAEELFLELSKKGLRAVEVFHSDHTSKQSKILQQAASKIGLAVTGGSDFHGAGRSKASLGSLHLPLSILENLRSLS